MISVRSESLSLSVHNIARSPRAWIAFSFPPVALSLSLETSEVSEYGAGRESKVMTAYAASSERAEIAPSTNKASRESQIMFRMVFRKVLVYSLKSAVSLPLGESLLMKDAVAKTAPCVWNTWLPIAEDHGDIFCSKALSMFSTTFSEDRG